MLKKKWLLNFVLLYFVLIIHCIFTVNIYANESSAVMEIEAKVLCPAQIESTKDIDFGKVLSGTKNNTAKGQFRIRHDNEESVEVIYAGVKDITEVILRNEETNDTLPVSIRLNRSSNRLATDKSRRTELKLQVELIKEK